MKMLVIEDEENNLFLITRLAERAGFQVISARTGNDGFAAAKSEKPGVILLDIGLPDIDGREVLKMIRQDEAIKDTPVIAMTSYAMSGDRQQLMSMGCSGYIEKPYDPSTVIEQIKEILEFAEK